jgi:hypothetical protein
MTLKLPKPNEPRRVLSQYRIHRRVYELEYMNNRLVFRYGNTPPKTDEEQIQDRAFLIALSAIDTWARYKI